ncbi:hypothetical protein [Streptomyces sp. NPDC003006]
MSWCWILLINVPIGALAITAALPFLAADGEHGRGQRLDVPGAALATAGVGSLAYGISQIEGRGWSGPTTAVALAVGALALVAFVAVEARFARAPLMPPRLFRIRAISWAIRRCCWPAPASSPCGTSRCSTCRTCCTTGLGFLPHTLVGIAGARLAPRVMERIGARRLIVLSAAVSAAGFLWRSRATPDSGYLIGLLGPAVVMSAGMGLLITPITTTVTFGVGDVDAGSGSTPAALSGDYGRAFLAMVVMAAMLVAVDVGVLALPVARERERGGAGGPGVPRPGSERPLALEMSARWPRR